MAQSSRTLSSIHRVVSAAPTVCGGINYADQQKRPPIGLTPDPLHTVAGPRQTLTPQDLWRTKVSVAPTIIAVAHRPSVVARSRSRAPVAMDGNAYTKTHKWSDMTSDDPGSRTAADRYLLAQVREAFGRVVYSHKTHEKQADMCFRKYRWQQAVLVTLTAISSGTFLVSVLGVAVSPKVGSLVTSFIALLVTGITLATKTFNFADEADAHRATASRLWDVRESYLSLIADLMSRTVSGSDARTRRDELQEAARSAYADAPRTTSKAFKKASDGLQNNEEMTFTSLEIDLFLPNALRLNESAA